ncbi:hypothetical protein D3C81_1897040 [compost metagenome]
MLKPLTASEKVMVTSEVSPALSVGSDSTMVAVGRWVSIEKLFESVVPLPALPARSTTPVLSRVTRFVVSVMLALGVKVAVQVIPPSLLLKPLKVPFSTIRSAVVSPVTASLNVIVTNEVSPMASVSSATTMVAVGRSVSMA